jgi:hypothetical protein
MRRQLLLVMIIVLMIAGAAAYHYNSISYKRVDIYISNNFKKEGTSPIVTIGNKKSLKVVSRAVSTGRKIDGILDVAPPDYIFDIYDNKNRLTTMCVWLESDSINGMYMYADKTETGYSITEESTNELKEILLIAR